MKSIVITGATSGIGYECAMQMGRIATGEQIVIACRDLQAGHRVAGAIKRETGHKNVICLLLDLASLSSIRAFREHFAKTGGSISVLINNAGLQIVDGTRYTKDGFEQTFGVNHLAPFYLTLLLLPYTTEDAHIVFTASGTHDPEQKTGMPVPVWTDVQKMAYPEESTEKISTTGQRRYTTSKLCNILTVYELQKRLKDTKIRVNAFDPGMVPGTGLARSYSPVLRFAWKSLFRLLILFRHNVNTAERSGRRLATLAYSDRYRHASGKYFEGEKEIRSSVDSYDQELQRRLWVSSVELTGVKQQETIVPVY